MGSNAQPTSFHVARHATDSVQSALPPSNQVIELVGADIFPPRCYDPNIFFFRAPADDNAGRSGECQGLETGSSVNSRQSPWMGGENLISSLRQFLGGPLAGLAGRMGENHSNGSSYFLRCTNEGVPLTSASTPEPLPAIVKELEGLVSRHGADLTPILPPPQALNNLPPLFVQLTRFACGSLAIGIAFHHTLGDGSACFLIANAWAEVAKTGQVSAAPFLDRTRFAAYHKFGRGEDVEVAKVMSESGTIRKCTSIASEEVRAGMVKYCDRAFVLKNAQSVSETPLSRGSGFDSTPLPLPKMTPGKDCSSNDVAGPTPVLPPPGKEDAATKHMLPRHRADNAGVAIKERHVAVHRFHVSANQLKTFKAKLVGDPDCHLAPGEWLSTNDCLCALMWKALRGAMREDLEENDGGEYEGEGLLSFPMNFRGKMEPDLANS